MTPVFNSERLGTKPCPACGAVYEICLQRSSESGHQVFACVVCGERLVEWGGTVSLTFTLLTQPAAEVQIG